MVISVPEYLLSNDISFNNCVNKTKIPFAQKKKKKSQCTPVIALSVRETIQRFDQFRHFIIAEQHNSTQWKLTNAANPLLFIKSRLSTAKQLLINRSKASLSGKLINFTLTARKCVNNSSSAMRNRTRMAVLQRNNINKCYLLKKKKPKTSSSSPAQDLLIIKKRIIHRLDFALHAR